MNKVYNWTELDKLGFIFYETRLEEDFNILHKCFSPIIATYIAKNFPKYLNSLKEIKTASFSSIYEHINEFNPEYKFSQWAFTIVKNECFQVTRRKYSPSNRMNNGMYPIAEGTFSKLTSNNIEEIYDEEYKKYILEKINRTLINLKEPYSSILKARFLEDKKIKEVALEYGVSENTVKTWTRDGIRVLQKALGIHVPRKKEKGKWNKPLCERSRRIRAKEKLKITSNI